MKRISFQLFFLLLTCLLQAQTQVTIQGVVTKISDGSPVPNWYVLAFGGDPADSTVFVYGAAATDPSGSYSFVVDVPPGINQLLVVTSDGCNNNPGQLEQLLNVNSIPVSVDFQVCGDQPVTPDCQTWFWYSATGGFTLDYFADFYAVDGASAASYSWDFGDGATSTEASPSHTYAGEGLYTVSLTITSETGCEATYTEQVFVFDQPPFPNCWTWIDLQHTADSLTFSFSAQYWGLDTFPAASYLWDFGDGTTSTEANPVHTYVQEGIYTVQLTALTEDSCEAYSCVVVFAYNCPVDTFWYGCQAMFTAGYNWWDPIGNPAGNDPLTISFYDMSMGAVLTWAWDFGDSTYSSESNPTHTYAQAGFYTVTLSITTIDGCQSTASFDIYVGDDYPWTPEPDCQALFIPVPDSIGSNGLQFLDLSLSPNPITSWHWDFGDGTTSDEQNPFHVYAQPGTYTVSLEIEADSCNSIITFDVDTQNPWNFNREPAQLGLAGTLTSAQEPEVFEAVKIYPNPVQSELNARFNATVAGDYELRVTDLSGKTLVQLKQNAQTGDNQARVNVTSLVPGFYLAELRSEGGIQTFKFVKN